METKEMKFKAGDIVRVLPLSWYDYFKDKYGNVWPKDVGVKGAKHYFTKEMAKWCGTYFEIIDVIDGGYKVYGMEQILEDWMIENKKFNRNENKIEDSMETKKMTIAEAQEFMNNTKIICTSVEETKRVQKKMFELGINWAGEQAEDVNDDAFLLFVEDYKLLFDGDISYWMTEESRRIEPSEILAIEIKQEPKPKFDPKTLQPFDKVLVRQDKVTIWQARIFEACVFDGKYSATSGGVFNYCIPFNDETKHLLRTNDEAPEFYQLD